MLPCLLLLAGGVHAGDAAQVPDDCRLEPGNIRGETATMACYEALDSNSDGSLSESEAAALPRLQGRFQSLDADGSGALSPDEFQAGRHTPAQRGGGKGV
jgi:hypothetical protein